MTAPRRKPRLSPLAAENLALRAEVRRLRLLCAISPDALADVLDQLAAHSPPEDLAGHLREVTSALRGNGAVPGAGLSGRQELPAAFVKPAP
jgi:hypothetical protein